MLRKLLWRPAIVLALLFSFAVVQAQVNAVRINEILAVNTQVTNIFGEFSGMVELHNTGASDADISGCFLTHSTFFDAHYVFPAGTVLTPGAYLVVPCDSIYANVPDQAAPFSLRRTGNALHFWDASLNILDSVVYGLQVQDRSLVRTGPATWTLGIPSLGTTNTTVPLGSPSGLRINEWLADSLPDEEDLFEVYNSSGEHVALWGLTFSNTIVHSIVAPLSFIGTGAQAFATFIANGRSNLQYTNPADWVSFKLRAEGATLSIFDNNQLIHRIAFGEQSENISEGYLPDGNTNRVVRFPRINDYQTKSFGAPNFLLLTNVFVNELLSHSSPPKEDVVEFFNQAGTNVDIGGWWLSNDRGNLKKYLLPPGTSVPANGHLTIYEGTGAAIGFNSSSALVPFTFDGRHGGEIVLSQTDSNGNLTGVRVYEEFETAPEGVSFGHHKTSVPEDYKFVAMTQTTFGADGAGTVAAFRLGSGASNAPPTIGPVVINEIMYAPSNTIYYTNGIPVFGPNPAEQFIELHNISDQPVPLYDPAFPTNRWRLQNALSYVFPVTNLAPNSFCLIVAFNPWTDTAAVNAFRSKYQVSIEVPLFGPWAGRLQDNVGAVELYRPEPVVLPPDPEAGYVPYVRVDKVKYGAAYPGGQQWVRTLNGASLQRKDPLAFGNDPINWAAARTTAGAPSPVAITDTDLDGMPNDWELQYGFNPTNSLDASLDADGDSSSNLGEFLAGSNPTNALSVLRIFRIIPPAADLPPGEQATTIQFFAYSNTSYRVEFRNSLDANWERFQTVPALSFERMVFVSDYYPPPRRFYRIVAPVTN